MESGSKKLILEYRPWKGQRVASWMPIFSIAREAVYQLFRRKVFWLIYALGLLVFFLYFFGQYLFFWVADQQAEPVVRVGGFGRANPNDMLQFLRGILKMDGSAETFRNFFSFQARALVILLAFAGTTILGEDLIHGTLLFFQSKPRGLRNYLVGKFLAASLVVHLLTTLPALLLFFEICFLESWSRLWTQQRVFWGILGYGVLLNAGLVPLLFASAASVRKTVPMILLWAGLFLLIPSLCMILVEGLGLSPAWRMLDVWGCLECLGERCLGAPTSIPGQRPDLQIKPILAGLSLSLLSVFCLAITRSIYLRGENE
ncbi:MAG: hypothetical protein EXR99_01375 [Gemmataceae bacterium]|nr:hypothetical protein [Gemmataceae bacterium]